MTPEIVAPKVKKSVVAIGNKTVELNDFSDVIIAQKPFKMLAAEYGEALAAEQLRLEHEAYGLGEERFLKMLARQVESGEIADNAAAKPLVATLVPRLAKRLEDWIDESYFQIDPETGLKKGRRGKRSVSQRILKDVDPMKVAALTIRSLLGSLCSNAGHGSPLIGSAIKVGYDLQDELRFSRLRELEAKHFKEHVEKQLSKRVGIHYRKEFLKVIEADMLDKKLLGGQSWVKWEADDVLQVGVKLIELTIEATGLIRMEREGAGIAHADSENIYITDEYIDALLMRSASLAGISPVYQPCVVPPKPWVEFSGGGYWAVGRRPLKLVRTRHKKGAKRYRDVHMPDVYDAVNIAQATPWRVNQKVLDVANVITNWKNCPVADIPRLEREELPIRPDDIDTNEVSLKLWKKEAAGIYRRDKARVSKRLSIEFMLQQANKFSHYDAIWFPANLDWRGRVYSVPSFNPQGSDLVKGLLTFASGKPIGADGLYWLKIHGANCAGVDKVPFPERIDFIESNHANILASASDPLVNTWWAEQDSPFCFLAFCFEYQMVHTTGLGYVCNLPLAFDGSCSGIQHFSAILRDEEGGAAVNLIPSETVQDIYRIVADKVNKELMKLSISGSDDEVQVITNKDTGEVTERLKLGTKSLSNQWLKFGVTRKVTKRPVMTLAYGAKKFGFSQQISEDTIRPALDSGEGLMFTHPTQSASFMAQLIWDAVGTTVVAAVEAMSWLQSAAKLLAAEVKDKDGNILRNRCPIHWVTPDGFPVWQEYCLQTAYRLNLMFLGQFRYQPTRMVDTNEIDAKAQEAGIAPNFVHSQDGNHLRMTVRHAHNRYGIKNFALIHDSFGTIPADAGNLFKAVRESMVSIYESNDVLLDFYEQFCDQLHETQLEKMPPIPAKGKLNLSDILKSDFAFA
ncbi:RNA polymerase [Pectobacterium phage DU_PP_II]|uniref:DNA-directed RNA polymerase n=1 Tax=Pectobacterium phage DU_PP_II TaxID=2041489 RepID=A0A2D2W5U8_9CAUD|nr:RNA polymerase [Pectobacterium phage DU_PP_II]ATS93671.1 RNA polymerase [Pectobacterium phage DU_PP_II]